MLRPGRYAISDMLPLPQYREQGMDLAIVHFESEILIQKASPSPNGLPPLGLVDRFPGL